jgi:hypothetical protein
MLYVIATCKLLLFYFYFYFYFLFLKIYQNMSQKLGSNRLQDIWKAKETAATLKKSSG